MRTHFLALQHSYHAEFIWDDEHIRVGDKWEREIQIYLTSAPLAILLVSPYFAASNYIRNKELPTLLDRYSRGEVVLIPVMVGYQNLNHIGLSGFKTIPSPERPLISLNPAARQRCYNEIAEQVEKELIMRFSAPTSPTSATSADVRKKPASKRLTALKSAEPPSWKLTVPAVMATNEIEHQLRQLVKQTTRRGFLVFSRGKHYVQYAYYKQFDATSVIIEVISNAYLPDEFPLSKLQVQHLLRLGFKQWSDEENFLQLAPVDTEGSLGELSTMSWHILDDVLNCPWDSNLEVSGQCW